MQKSGYCAAFWLEQELCVYSADEWVYGAELYVYSAALMGKERAAGLQCRGLGLQRSYLGRKRGGGLQYRGGFIAQLSGKNKRCGFTLQRYVYSAASWVSES